jgi:7,8-dihydro-6-hydroxymethylpterin-pyrophosphokinase
MISGLLMQESSSCAAVALGSNLVDSHRYLLQAPAALLSLPGCAAFRFSSIYLITPTGGEASSDYLNAAAVLETYAPHPVLKVSLRELEQRLEPAHLKETYIRRSALNFESVAI